MSDILVNIDGVECKAKEGEFVLNIARANDIFIPALCYLSNCSPTLACRLCLVEVDGKRAYSCNAKAKDGMSIITKNEEIEKERKAIMEIYDVNHPLECGVCDQSGECELQNYTMEMEIDSQSHSIADMPRPATDWGKIHYDPSLCIVCERCVTVCKDMIGESALKTVKRGGPELDKEWKEKTPKDAYAMWNKLQKSIIGVASGADTLECTMCGECSSVCPVGALVSSDFQYKANAWELKKIPAANPHSSDCSLIYYDVRHDNVTNSNDKIFRVSNDYSFGPIHGGARYGYDFENVVEGKDEEAFEKVINTIKTKVDTIEFNSFITNEEALILQKLKDKYGYKLVNDDAYAYKKFLDNFASTSGENLYSGDLKSVQKSNFVISVGTAIKTDSPNAGYAFNNALSMNKGAGLYFHPVADPIVDGYSKNLLSLNHKVGAEEAVLYLILDIFGKNLPIETADYLKSFHTTCKQTVGEGEEAKEIEVDENSLFEILGIDDFSEKLPKLLAKKDSFSLIAGEDLYNHSKSKNLAKLLGLIQKYTDFSVVIIPSQTNTLGVSIICDLNKNRGEFTLGYNVKADVTLSALGKGDLDMPALNQQEGTFTSMNKRVVPTNAALPYNGYCLNDIANELGFDAEFTIDYTAELPTRRGFKAVAFDSLPNEFTRAGVENRGYLLSSKIVTCKDEVDEISETKAMNSPLYLANPVQQFSAFTNRAHQLNEAGSLYASSEFLEKRELKSGDMVVVEGSGGVKLTLRVEVDLMISGDIPYLPTFDTKLNAKQFFP
ncbi:MAG TPA: NADH-quinone oxidoreductase subunit G, partial [Sulfurospirillum arcachonense]|nr:NADH-quinone oxidoreductase subunit G [Sulfurospirillum arcachonense]